MKEFFVLLFLLGSLSANAAEFKVIAPVTYTVKSDTYTNDLLSGQVRVKGRVLDRSGIGMSGTLISTIDERVSAYTNETGSYEMIIHDSDTSLYMYRDGYEEVAMERYDFIQGHTVIVDFMPPIDIINGNDPIPDKVTTFSLKPVIYLYSIARIKVSMDLDYVGDLTFTYPQYNESWRVNVDANGIHSEHYDKSYPYLFWEGEMDDLNYEKENGKLLGELVVTDTVVDYLERQLSAIGLNRTEQTDFITFWAPRMMDKKYVFIQFLLDDLYSSRIASLTLSKDPDSQKRVYLLFSTYDEPPTVQSIPQKFEPFERKGFTLIEWGGSNLTTLKAL